MAVDVFLKFGDIKGESQDDEHKDWIEVLSFSWGVSNPAAALSSRRGAGGGAGKVDLHDMTFSHKTDRSTPLLMQACATGQHIKEGTLTVRKKGSNVKNTDYLTYKLSDILVSSYQTSGSSSTPPLSEVSLNFSKIEMDFVDLESGDQTASSCSDSNAKI